MSKLLNSVTTQELQGTIKALNALSSEINANVLIELKNSKDMTDFLALQQRSVVMSYLEDRINEEIANRNSPQEESQSIDDSE